jgi:hypothetical protein
VLASLFDVEAMCNEIPDHIYESDPSLEWVTCPCCDGEKWLEVEGSVWTKALFSDPRRAYAHRALNHSYKVCGRCCGVGEVLDDLTSSDAGHDGMGFPHGLLWHGVSNLNVVIKTTSRNPRNTPVKVQDWQLAA